MLYDLMLDKLMKGIFKNRKGNLNKNLFEGKEIFYELSIEDQCKVLHEVIRSFQADTQNIDLHLINQGKNAGTVTLSKNIDKCKECFLINQSVTGLYRSEVDLLHI